MNFWNIAVPALTFLAPAVACLYFLVSGKARLDAASSWGTAVFGLVMLVSVVGAVQFESPVRLEFLWPFSAEPSGYFEFTLQLYWTRFIWIFFSNAVLLAFALFDGKASFLGGPARGFKFVFLTGASLFSSVAYLSENVFLSLLFIELMVFLLYAFSVLAGPKEETQERMSYFKRSCFIFLALLATLALAFTREFNVSSIILIGVVLYIISFIFSKHSLPDWRHLSLMLLQAGTVFFLLGRVIGEDMSSELWVPLTAIFGVGSAIFAALSLLSISALGSSFWLVFSVLGYLLFLRFSSGRHEDSFWGTYEAIALLSVFALAAIFRFSRKNLQAWEKAAALVIAFVLLAVISGALPGVDIAGARVTVEAPVKLVSLGLLTFLISMVVGKSLAVSFSDATTKDSQSFLPGLLPGFFVLVVEIAAVMRMTDIYGESPYRMGAAYLLTNPHIIVAGSGLILGLVAGMLLGFNSRFVNWIRPRETRMEELFPRIDPIVIGWNHKLVTAPKAFRAWFAARVTSSSSKSATYIQETDRSIFGDRLYQGFRKYSLSLSRGARFFHSGNIRAYMFTGMLVVIFASILFLMEGR